MLRIAAPASRLGLGQLVAGATSALLHATVVVVVAAHAAGDGAAARVAALRAETELLVEPRMAAVAEVEAPPRTSDARLAPARATHTHSSPVAASHDATPHAADLVHVAPSTLEAPRDAPHDVVALAAPSAAAPPARFVLNVGDALAGGGHAAEPRPSVEAAVDERATLVSGLPPAYPRAARDAEIEADVPLDLVVDASGTVVSARALRNVGYGLESAAVEAVRAYHFLPAKKAGRAVAVQMRWSVQFRLQ